LQNEKTTGEGKVPLVKKGLLGGSSYIPSPLVKHKSLGEQVSTGDSPTRKKWPLLGETSKTTSEPPKTPRKREKYWLIGSFLHRSQTSLLEQENKGQAAAQPDRVEAAGGKRPDGHGPSHCEKHDHLAKRKKDGKTQNEGSLNSLKWRKNDTPKKWTWMGLTEKGKRDMLQGKGALFAPRK